MDRELRQGELITDLIQYIYQPTSELADVTAHPLVIVLSQDCDLLWDFEQRIKGGQGNLNGVLVYEVHVASEFKGTLPGGDIWRRLIQNKDERYHFLEAVPPALDRVGQGLPEGGCTWRE
jgi:hypothetical protein